MEINTTTLPAAALLLLLLTTLFFLLLLHLPSSKRHLLPPGPAPWPVVGSLLTMLPHKPRFRWVLSVAGGNDITCVRLGNVHVVVVNCPELAREFLGINHDANFASRPVTMATEYSGRGFRSVGFAPWGEQWKKMRRVVASEVLSPARLQSQKELRLQEADHLVNYIFNQCKSKPAVVDVRLAARYYCGNIVRRMVFGRRWFGEGGRHCGPGEEEVGHVEAAFEVLSIAYSFCVSDFMPALRWMDLDGHERRMRKAVGVINKYHDPIIDERVEMRSRRSTTTKAGKEEEVVAPEDVLDVFISLKDGDGKPLLTVEDIKAQSAVRLFRPPT